MTVAQPFSCHREEGVLYLDLNTPGCEVNVLSDVAAEQLLDIFSMVNPRRDRAVVIRSSKPGSFINGARLLGAAIVRSPRHLLTLSSTERRAYHAVGDCPVPTIAVIQGMCYGCGVEFTLFCDYAVAVNTGDTCFYMTELSDNLITTTFEGNIRLPLIMGLKPSIDFLLWGARLNAQEALRVGLVDHVAEHDLIQSAINGILDSIKLSGRWRAHEQRLCKKFRDGTDIKVLERTRRHIAALPPHYQKEFAKCLDLAEATLRRGKRDERLCSMEITQCGRSLVKDKGKKALSFFFIRQLARSFCLRGATSEPVTIRIARGLEETTFKADVEARWCPGITFRNSGKSNRRNISSAMCFHLVEAAFCRPRNIRRFAGREIAVELGVNESASDCDADAVLYDPQYVPGNRLFELAAQTREPWLASLGQVLVRMGYQLVISNPAPGGLALNRLLRAYLAPLVRYRLLGGSVETINFTMRKFGFIRRPHALLTQLDREGVVRLLAPRVSAPAARVSGAVRALGGKKYEEGRYDRRLIDGLCLSLLATAVRCLDDGTLGHVSLVDLLAREVLDFPLMHCSLCKYLNLSRIQTMVKRASRFRELITVDELAQAKVVLSTNRRFYL